MKSFILRIPFFEIKDGGHVLCTVSKLELFLVELNLKTLTSINGFSDTTNV